MQAEGSRTRPVLPRRRQGKARMEMEMHKPSDGKTGNDWNWNWTQKKVIHCRDGAGKSYTFTFIENVDFSDETNDFENFYKER